MPQPVDERGWVLGDPAYAPPRMAHALGIDGVEGCAMAVHSQEALNVVAGPVDVLFVDGVLRLRNGPWPY